MTVGRLSMLLSLLATLLVSAPAGSFYSWSVFIDPLAAARPSWQSASVHANTCVLVFFGLAASVCGPLEKVLGTVKMSLLGAILTGTGACLCGLAIYSDMQTLLYVGGAFNGFGLAPCYVAGVHAVMQVWAQHKGFASGFFMMVSSSGSFIFAWTNFALVGLFRQQGRSAASGLALAFLSFGALCGCMQLLGTGIMAWIQAKQGVPASLNEDIDDRAYTQLGDDSVNGESTPVPVLRVVLSPQFWLLLMVFMCDLSPMMGVLFIAVDFLQKDYGMSYGHSTTLLALINVVGTVMRLFVGLIQPRVGTKPLFAAALVIQLGIFSLLPTVHNRGKALFALLYGMLLLAKVCYGAGFTLINLLAGEVFGDVNGVQVYSLLIFGFVAAALLSPTLAAASAVSFSSYCYVSSALALLGLVGLALLRPFDPHKAHMPANSG